MLGTSPGERFYQREFTSRCRDVNGGTRLVHPKHGTTAAALRLACVPVVSSVTPLGPSAWLNLARLHNSRLTVSASLDDNAAPTASLNDGPLTWLLGLDVSTARRNVGAGSSLTRLNDDIAATSLDKATLGIDVSVSLTNPAWLVVGEALTSLDVVALYPLVLCAVPLVVAFDPDSVAVRSRWPLCHDLRLWRRLIHHGALYLSVRVHRSARCGSNVATCVESSEDHHSPQGRHAHPVIFLHRIRPPLGTPGVYAIMMPDFGDDCTLRVSSILGLVAPSVQSR